MAGPIDVRDPADPRLADYVSLTDSALRISMESRDGVFIAEGEKVIRRALAAGFAARSLLVTQSRLAQLGRLAQARAAWWYWKTWSTTATWGRSSAARRRSAPTR